MHIVDKLMEKQRAGQAATGSAFPILRVGQQSSTLAFPCMPLVYSLTSCEQLMLVSGSCCDTDC